MGDDVFHDCTWLQILYPGAMSSKPWVDATRDVQSRKENTILNMVHFEERHM